MAGIRLFGDIFKKSGTNCSPFPMLTGFTEIRKTGLEAWKAAQRRSGEALPAKGLGKIGRCD